ncbi:hypothetical protein [Streptomyces adelaidensis]|uniref:hypothetical protein n=1 Tax=Streptomyces adelaidensis TaxID=2796465 RepID=UPI00190417E7|nr:hypothetical protein [Streptomyces adelaidensis]
MQRPCGEAVPPKTYLLRGDDGLYRIQWDHPEFDKGCLTLLSDGDFRNMFEPWDDCGLSGSSQLFRIEKGEGQEDQDGWRVRPVRGEGECVGIRGGADEREAVAVAEPCVEEASAGAGGDSSRQRFLID